MASFDRRAAVNARLQHDAFVDGHRAGRGILARLAGDIISSGLLPAGSAGLSFAPLIYIMIYPKSGDMQP